MCLSTTDGRAFGFGANDWLQLSLGAARGVRGIDGTWPAVEEAPVQIEVGPAGASCVGLTAGGDSSMFVVEHTQVAAVPLSPGSTKRIHLEFQQRCSAGLRL